MGTLQIEVGDLHFSARWEPDAPQTIEAIRRMLPIDSKALRIIDSVGTSGMRNMVDPASRP